eukprot:g12291.t2
MPKPQANAAGRDRRGRWTLHGNSYLQCLSNIPQLREFFLEGKYKENLNRNAHKTEGRIDAMLREGSGLLSIQVRRSTRCIRQPPAIRAVFDQAFSPLRRTEAPAKARRNQRRKQRREQDCAEDVTAWVRSQDALLCCNFRVALQQGEILASRGAAGTSSIPLDFDGDAWLPGKRKRQAQLPKPHRKVPIFRHDFEPGFVESFTSKCREILCSGRPLSENYYVRQFEESFAQLSHVPFALATTSGTQALAIALRALDVAGKAVVIPSNTFFATQVAALNAGANLEWVDIEKEYMQVCPRSLEAVLHRHQHGRVGAVILVHIAGIISPNFAQIRRLCQTYGAPLVEERGSLCHGTMFTP